MRKIKALQEGIIAKHSNPNFHILFDSFEPKEVDDATAEILLKNKDMFREVKKTESIDKEKEREKRKSSFGKPKIK